MQQTIRLSILIIFTNGFLLYAAEKEHKETLSSQISEGLYKELQKEFVKFKSDYASIRTDIQSKPSLPYATVVEQYGKLFLLTTGITSKQAQASQLLLEVPQNLKKLHLQFHQSIHDLQKAMIDAYRHHRLHMIESWDLFDNTPIFKGENSPIKGGSPVSQRRKKPTSSPQKGDYNDLYYMPSPRSEKEDEQFSEEVSQEASEESSEEEDVIPPFDTCYSAISSRQPVILSSLMRKNKNSPPKQVSFAE